MATEHQYSPAMPPSPWSPAPQSWDGIKWSGYNPNMDKTPKQFQEHRRRSELSDSSSIYSQPEWTPRELESEPSNGMEIPIDGGLICSNSSTYTRGESSANKLDFSAEDKRHPASTNAGAPKTNQVKYTKSSPVLRFDVPSLEDNRDSTDLQQPERGIISPRSTFGGERNQKRDYRYPALLPSPPVLPSQSKKSKNLEAKLSSIFGLVRDSKPSGIVEAASPSRKRDSIPGSKKPARFQTLPPSPTHHKDHGNGERPMTNPFPTCWTRRNSEHIERKAGLKRFSGTIRQPGISSSTKKEAVIDQRRSATGPNTPISPKSGFLSMISPTELRETFQIGSEELEQAVSKAKHKISVRTATERRRESLKKKITVIGISDQAPGMLPLAKTDTNDDVWTVEQLKDERVTSLRRRSI